MLERLVKDEESPETPAETRQWGLRHERESPVNHAYTPETLSAAQAHSVEEALWTALRALEEQAAIKKRLGERMRRQHNDAGADQLLKRARDLQQNAEQVRALLLNGVGANES